MLKPRNSFAREYHLKKWIDMRGLAEVWEAMSVKNHLTDSVALKIFPTVYTAGIKEIEAGYAKQPYLWHNNLLAAKRLGIYENRPYLEMHFCGNGNISSKVLQLSENEIAKCLQQIASALAYLHENSILHGCVKPNNILLDGDNYYLYLADLGLSAELRETIERFVEVNNDDIVSSADSSSTRKSPARINPPCYCAPELFENNPQPSTAADIWALGASIFEIVTGKLPFGHLGGEAQRRNNAVLKDISQNFSPDLNLIIKRCLSKNKENRPTAQEIEEVAKVFLKEKIFELPAKKAVEIVPAKKAVEVVPDKTATEVAPTKQMVEAAPLKQTVDVAPPIKNVFDQTPDQEKQTRWKTAMYFLVPIIIVGIILFAYIKWTSNSPEYKVKPLQETKTTKDSVIKINPAATNPTTVPIEPPKTNLQVTPPNLPTTVPKVEQNKPMQFNRTKAVEPLSAKQSTAPKSPKKEKVKTVDPGIPKHKDNEQIIDPDNPKHKDQ